MLSMIWGHCGHPFEAKFLRNHNRHVGNSCRMDETYVKVKGQWCYLYRAVDKIGKTIDFI